MIQPETITRLRNALAQVALDWLDAPASPRTSAASALPFSSMTEADWRQAVTLWHPFAAELLGGVSQRACPACGGDQSRFLFFSYDAHPFHECDGCGCWFEPRVVDASLFERFFESCPDARLLAERMMNARDRAEGRDADMARVGGYLDELLSLLPPSSGAPRAYLDAGCGVGHSLRAGRLRELTVQGVEADRTAVARARASGLPVADLADPIPPGPYHVLSFWETLEHVAAPIEAIQRYLPYLDADGLVAITVPNLNALATRSLRESCAWVHGGYNTPGHINLFSPGSLDRLLTRAGLSLLDVDGQFSANPVELAAYLTGETRGAFDTLGLSATGGALSRTLADVLAGAWPGAALVERLGLVAPILHVVACRKGREERFTEAVAARRARRGQAMADEARALIAGEPDYKAMAAALEQEVARRDALLTEATKSLHREAEAAARLQQEINRRDGLLGQLQQTANDLQHQLAGAQGQINLRDDLLAALQRQFDDTIDARARRTLRALRRVAKS